MNNKLVSMPSSDYISSMLNENFLPTDKIETVRSISDLREYLLQHLGPLSKDSEGLILLALNDWTAKFNDPNRPLAVLQHLVIVSKDQTVNQQTEHLNHMGLVNRDRSKDIVIKEVSSEDLGQTLFIGSISDRAYVTIIVANTETLTHANKGILQNELYAFNRFIQNSYETLQPFRAGELPE